MGVPSRKGCVVNGENDKGKQQMSTPPLLSVALFYLFIFLFCKRASEVETSEKIGCTPTIAGVQWLSEI